MVGWKTIWLCPDDMPVYIVTYGHLTVSMLTSPLGLVLWSLGIEHNTAARLAYYTYLILN